MSEFTGIKIYSLAKDPAMTDVLNSILHAWYRVGGIFLTTTALLFFYWLTGHIEARRLHKRASKNGAGQHE